MLQVQDGLFLTTSLHPWLLSLIFTLQPRVTDHQADCAFYLQTPADKRQDQHKRAGVAKVLIHVQYDRKTYKQKPASRVKLENYNLEMKPFFFKLRHN